MTSLALKNGWTGGQYSFFRALLGLYLVIHFMDLLPWAAEVFSSQGMLADGSLSPLIHLFPNIFLLNDAPLFVQGVIVSGMAAAFFFMMGHKDKMAALWALYVLACLFGRNPLIANPALPYLGFMLLAHVFIPSAAYGSYAARGRADLSGGWVMPKDVFTAAWIVLALSYTYSGYTKLLSPSWVAGENINYVLSNPLARDYFLRDLLLWLPPVFLKVLTWSVLYIELLFAPLALIPRLRPFLWGLMALIQMGFACLLNFFDLTAVMLLFHLFTFDPAWIKGKVVTGKPVLFYDGQCGLCHAVVRFLLAEDKAGQISLSPLQGKAFSQKIPESQRKGLPDSIVLKLEDGSLHIKSSAVAILLFSLGGLWRPLGHFLWMVPRSWRDFGYSSVGNIRKKLFKTPEGLCPIVSPELRSRFID